jgi:GNAT superfamily N-acetyltransferase
MQLALEHSLCFGVYDERHGGRQVGLARVVTDYAIFAYLCDVYILEGQRGKGLGRWLLEVVRGYPELHGLRRWALVTRDAHGLYRQFGFEALSAPERWMEAFDPAPQAWRA